MADLLLGVKIGVEGGPQTVRQVKAIDDEVKKLQAQNKRVAETAKALSEAYNLSDTEVNDLINQLKKLENQTDSAADSTGNYRDAMGRLRNANGRFIKDGVDGFNKLAQEGKQSANAIENAYAGVFQGVGQKITEIGIEALRSSVSAVIGVVSAASNEFGAFQRALTEFDAKSSATAEQIERIGEQSKELAAVTSQTPAGVAALATALLTLGATADQVEENLQGITFLADVLGEDPVLTGQAVQTGINIWGEFGETADSLSDKINFLVNNTAAGATSGIGEFFQLFADVGGIVKSTGAEFDDLASAFAVLRNGGASASIAATGIKTALLALSAPTSAANAELEKIGVSAFNSNGEFIGLGETLQLFSENLGSLTDQQQLDLAVTIFGREGAPAFLQALKEADGSLARIREQLGTDAPGSLAESLEVVNQSLERQKELLDGVISGLLTTLGETIAPIELGLVTFANELINATTEASDGLGALEDAAQRLGDTLRLNPEIAERLGEAFAELGDVAIQQLALILDAITAFVSEQDNIDAIAESFEQVGVAITNLGQGTRLIIALAESLIKLKTITEDLARSTKVTSASYNGLTTTVNALYNPIERVRQIVGSLADLWRIFNNIIENSGIFVANLIGRFEILMRNPVIRALVNQITQAETAVDGFGTSLSGGLSNSLEGVEQLGTQAAESIAEANASIAETASETAGAVEDVEEAKSALETLIDENKASLDQIAIDTANAKAELLESGGGQDELAALEQEGLTQRINNNKEFLKQLNALKTGGTITDPDELQKLSDQILQVESTLASDRVNLAQQVARAQQQLIEDTAKRELTALDTVAERREADFNEQKRLLNEEKTLLTEQANLTQANNDLDRERLETALARAEATGDEVAQERIRRQLIDLNERSIQQQFEAKQRSLEIETRLAEIEAQRSVVLAEIAVREARINLTRARGTDATAEEIENLEAILGLEQEGLDAARDSQGFVDEINDIKADQLDIEQEIAKEVQNQAEIENKNLEVNRKIEQAKKRQADAAKAATEAFNEQQQAEADAFREQQRRESEEFNRGLSALEREVQRRLQLEQATGDERARLTEQFKQEDEELVRRFELERQVLRERGSILGRLPDEVLNLSPLQAERAAFEQSQQEAQAVFDQQQQEEKAAFEEGLRQQEEAFEQRLRDEAFAALQAEQASASAFQQSQLTERATFNQGQRELDVANARQIASILQGVEPAPIEARRDGGAVLPGRSYLVGEEGPELITPGRRGWVQTAAQTAALLSGGAPRINGLPGHTGGIERKLDTLIGAVVANRRVSMAPSSYTLNSVNPIQDAVELQLQTIRRLTRMRGI